MRCCVRFRNLAQASQKTYRGALERLRLDYGTGSIVKLERKHVLKMMDKKAEHPGAANELLKMMKLLIGRAIDMGMRARILQAGPWGFRRTV